MLCRTIYLSLDPNMRLMRGKNFGKLLVRVAADPTR